MRTLVLALFALVRGFLAAKVAVALENAALRQQLAAYLRAEKRPRLQPGDRAFWVLVRRVWTDWSGLRVMVKPATVVTWHRGGFRAIWRWKSRPGRPRIPRRHIGFIKRISTDHPKWGEGATRPRGLHHDYRLAA